MKKTLFLVFLVMLTISASPAYASLSERGSWVGSYAVSSDGWGSHTITEGTIQAEVPAGATVIAAYLYSSLIPNRSLQTVTLNSSTVTFSESWTMPDYGITTGFADVTSIVKSVVDGGAGGIYDFEITEANTSLVDGEALVVVYELASLPEATIAIMDGYSAMEGDSFSINFAAPLNPDGPEFFARMAVASGYSYPNQSSTIDVNGKSLTTVAGNYDDGSAANGGLITVGGVGDDAYNTNSTYQEDDELYDLSTFVTSGDTSILVETANPSRNDNLFLAIFDVYGRAGINEAPPSNDVVPEPSTMVLFGFGLLGILGVSRKKTV